MKRLQTIASLAAAGALLAVPTVGQAHHGAPHGKAKGHGKSCANKPTVNKGFVVKGTLVSYNAGLPATGDETVTVNVTRRNRHARRVTLPTPYVLNSSTDRNGFRVVLSGYETGEVPTNGPTAGDKVRIIGKVAVTRKKCATPPTGRYGDVDVRRVRIVDAD